MISIIADGQKKIEQVSADERNLRLLINNIEDPMWLVDTDYHLVECNTAFRKWVACFIGTELNKGDHVLYNGRDKRYLEKFEMCYQLALQGRTFRSVEDQVVNGDVRYSSVCFNPVFDGDTVIAVNCYASDITEHRKYLRKIEEQNAALKEIAFIESHKVRGPVATILGLEQLFNYANAADPLNKVIMEGISKTTRDLDLIVREVVLKSNEIGLQA